MLNAQEQHREVNRLLSEIKEEHENIKDIFIDLGDDDAKYHFIVNKLEDMYKIRRQLQELVGDAAIAMIAQELGRDSASSETQQADLSREENQQRINRKAILEPPKLPTGYVALSEPRPLIGENDELWVVLADHSDLGLLIYEEHFCRAFLVAEECLTMFYTLMKYTQKFFDLCTPEYLNNPVHQSGLAMIRNWLNQKTEP